MQNSKSYETLPPAVVTALADKVNEAQAIIADYVNALSAKDVRALAKASDKTIAFVTKGMEYTTTNPDFIPAFTDMEAFKNNLANYNALNPVLKIANQLSANITDLILLCGSDAFLSALQYYNSVKQANKGNVKDAKEIYDDLSKRFPGRGKKRTPKTVEAESPGAEGDNQLKAA